MILEACVETLGQACKAESGGAHRLELCSRLDLDGLTPSIELVKSVLDAVAIPVKVMIRCRPGNFEYSKADMQIMKDEIRALKELSVSGFVFGALRGDKLDFELIQQVVEACDPLPVTVHKAIDLVRDPIASVGELKRLTGIRDILTSGGAQTALEGASTIRQMVAAGSGRIGIIAAGRITNKNRDHISVLTGTNQLHGKRIVGLLD